MIKLNGVEVPFEKFPNGETKVDGQQIINLMVGFNHIEFKYESDSDLIKLMFVKKHLDEYNEKSSITIYYMPYSRMDRVEENSVFTLKYVSEFINSLNFEKVNVAEPHSDVAMALLDKSKLLNVTTNILLQVLIEVEFDKDNDYLIFPDAGAQKRYGKLKGYKQLIGHKNRDFKTGEITKIDLVGEIPDKPFKAIIIDDLCSYGGTFYRINDDGKESGVASLLNKIGASEIYLIVAHAEEAIFKGSIFTGGVIDKVFTTDTILNYSFTQKFHEVNGKLKVYNIQEVI